MDAIDFEQFFVLPHIQYNGTDEPITFFDLTIGARSQIVAKDYAGRLSGSPSGTMCRKV